MTCYAFDNIEIKITWKLQGFVLAKKFLHFLWAFHWQLLALEISPVFYNVDSFSVSLWFLGNVLHGYTDTKSVIYLMGLDSCSTDLPLDLSEPRCVNASTVWLRVFLHKLIKQGFMTSDLFPEVLHINVVREQSVDSLSWWWWRFYVKYICKQNKFQHVHLYDEQDRDKPGRYIAQVENRGISEEKLCKSKLRWLWKTIRLITGTSVWYLLGYR